MGQPKKWSVFESITNVAVGYTLALVGQVIIYPIMHIPVTFKQNLLIGTFFLTIGMIRSYLLRRFFNWLHSIQYQLLAVLRGWLSAWKIRLKELLRIF